MTKKNKAVKDVADKIRELAETYPSDYEAAEAIGVRRETLSRWKNGAAVPRGMIVRRKLAGMGVKFSTRRSLT